MGDLGSIRLLYHNIFQRISSTRSNIQSNGDFVFSSPSSLVPTKGAFPKLLVLTVKVAKRPLRISPLCPEKTPKADLKRVAFLFFGTVV